MKGIGCPPRDDGTTGCSHPAGSLYVEHDGFGIVQDEASHFVYRLEPGTVIIALGSSPLDPEMMHGFVGGKRIVLWKISWFKRIA